MLQELIDTGAAPEIFAQGLERIEQIGGGCVCFVLYKNVAVRPGVIERHVAVRITAPLEGLPVALTQLQLLAETPDARLANVSNKIPA